MSFVKTNLKQMNLFSKSYTLSHEYLSRLEKTWAHDFRKIITENIKEESFSVLYSKNPASKPNKSITLLVGILIIKQIMQLTDAELVNEVHFDLQYQYALDLLDQVETGKTIICERTLNYFRKALLDHMNKTGIDLLHLEIERLSKQMAGDLNLGGKKFRMDSLMINTYANILGRRSLIRDVLSRTVKSINKINNTDDLSLNKSLKKYLDEKEYKESIKLENEEEDKLLTTDIKELMEFIKTHPEYQSINEANLFNRMVSDHTEVVEDKLQLKKNEDISSTSLITAVDPEATVRKKGKDKYYGYIANVREMYDDNGAGIITGIGFEQNVYSDATFCKDELKKIKDENNSGESTVVIDGAFFSGENALIAREQGVQLIPTHLKGYELTDKEKLASQFIIIENDGKVCVTCPQNHQAIKASLHESTVDTTNRNYYMIHMNKEHCDNCPHKDKCIIDKGSSKSYFTRLRISYIERIKAALLFSDKFYKDIGDERAAIEGIPSILRRRYKIDSLPVRGKGRIKMWFCLSIMAINFKRYRKRLATC